MELDLSAWPLQSISWVWLGSALKKIIVGPLGSLVLRARLAQQQEKNVFATIFAKIAANHVLQEQVKF